MIIAVLKEPPFESRVSLLAETAGDLIKKDYKILVEPGAGERAFSNDEQYESLGAELADREKLSRDADLLLGIHHDTIPAFLRDKVVIGVYQPLYQKKTMEEFASRGLQVLSLDMLPRTTRAQSMDVLSSQASIAGYKAVLMAANFFPRYFPMLMTAAGTIPPSKMLILGAGVAGLQALATARRLGAVVEVFDTRPAVKEEVLSLGGKFIDVEGAADPSQAGGYAVEQDEGFQRRQKEKIAESIARADIVITTAQIPGKSAPLLVTTSMIEEMKNGSVIMDLAASTGGNTDLTQNNKIVVHHGIRIIGNSNLASEVPYDASRMYGKNVSNFLQLLGAGADPLLLNLEDDLVRGCCITRGGRIVHERLQTPS